MIVVESPALIEDGELDSSGLHGNFNTDISGTVKIGVTNHIGAGLFDSQQDPVDIFYR